MLDRARERPTQRPAARRPAGAVSEPVRVGSVRTAEDLTRLQRAAGNQAVTGLLAPPDTLVAQRCGDHPCDCSPEERAAADGRPSVQRLAAHPDPGPNAPLSVQRDFLSDAWQGLTSVGPAVARAAQLVSGAISNPLQLPAVLAAIAWEEIPDALKGPLIDRVLRACLSVARTVEVPGPPGPSVGPILKHVAIGALERALDYPTGIKVRIADRMAQLILRPGADFAIGFLVGLLGGLWDGITGPFVLLWDLVKIGYEIQAAQLRLLASLADSESRETLTRDVRAALDRVGAQASGLLAQLRAGRADPGTILNLIDNMVNAALRGVESIGASLSDSLLRFLTRPDRQLGEGVGWVAGTATFEILLLVLTEGGYTALKSAATGLRAVIRMAETGAAIAEALAPVRAALGAFRGLAASNRALAPLVEAVEELLSLLVRYIRFSYGLGPTGGAARAGERLGGAAEHGASQQIRIADTAMRETHEITLLADGRLIRCSPTCAELITSVTERGPALAASRMPEESARLAREAEQITAEARALAANHALDAAERAAQERALLRRAASLERQTAAAELAALRRITDPARLRTAACRRIMAENPNSAALRQFDARLREIERDLEGCADLAFDPALRVTVEDEVRILAEEAREMEEAMRRLAPGSSAPIAPSTAGGTPESARVPELDPRQIEILEEFAEAQGTASRADLEADALDTYGVRDSDTPTIPDQPAPLDRGNFAHQHGDVLVPESQMPRGLEREVVITLPDGRIKRLDRVDRANGVIYEIKPNTPSEIASGEEQVAEYVRYMNEQHPRPGGWEGRVVTYDVAEAKRLLGQR
jgi:hypothetical protein